VLNTVSSFACILGAHVPHFVRCMPVLINMPDDKITTVHFNKKDERYKILYCHLFCISETRYLVVKAEYKS
jgi:hypothetical protein